MKFLFFDVECSNCFNGIGKICEFGYVLTDENFKIIKADEIPMSPGNGEGSRFNLRGRKNEKDLELAYDEDFYFSCPQFPTYYKFIRAMMEDKDTVCFAFSMDNDIAHLHNTCKRYRLDPINYTCYDVQKIASKYLEQNKQINLEDACRKIVGPNSMLQLIPHLSRDDAKMEMMILEAVTVLEKTDALTLLNMAEYSKTNSIEYMNKAVERLKRKQMGQKAHKFYNSICKTSDELQDPQYKGRRVCISGRLLESFDRFEELINSFASKGYVFCRHLYEADIFVLTGKSVDKDKLLEEFKDRFTGIILTLDEIDSFLTKN